MLQQADSIVPEQNSQVTFPISTHTSFGRIYADLGNLVAVLEHIEPEGLPSLVENLKAFMQEVQGC